MLRTSLLTSFTGLQSKGCKATAIELITKYFQGIWKILGNFQQTAGLQTQPCMVSKFWKIPEISAVEFCFTETLHLLFKFYLPLIHKIAFANTFQLNHKIKLNTTYHIFLHIKHAQSISQILLILFLNSNNESPDFTTEGRLLHMREPRK